MIILSIITLVAATQSEHFPSELPDRKASAVARERPVPEYASFDRMRAEKLASDGYRLWIAGNYVSSHNGGHYTNPDETTRVHDFWSNGKIAMVDTGDDGFFEAHFRITEYGPYYLGRSDGRNFRYFNHAAQQYDD